MTRFSILIFYFAFNVLNIYGQKDTLICDKVCIKISPFAALNPHYNSSIKAGVEYHVINDLHKSIEVGLIYPTSYNRGFTLKYELKYYKPYEKFRNQIDGDYNSIEFFYKYQAYETSDTINIKPFYKKDYKILKNVGCITYHFGTKGIYKSGIILDIYCGIGIRFKFTQSTLTEEENNNIQSSSDYDLNIITSKAGTFIYPNFDLGVKIGYKIK